MSLQLRRLAAIASVLAACLLSAPAVAAVNVGLTPPTQTVTPGSDFDVFLDITQAGSNFNGYDAVVSYDPAALTFLPLAPTSSQQGCLMTGGCSAACGNTFHLFSAAGDSLTVNNVLLCNGVSLTGPGHLYKFRFHASNTVQVTQVTIRRANFYNAGLFVTPVVKANCTIGIGVTLGVGDRTSFVTDGIRVEPNPSRGRVLFSPADGGAGLDAVDVVDLQGRWIRHLEPESTGTAALAWDGLDAAGQRVPAGIYLARVRRGQRLLTARVILLP
jgi:hypothetical protein